MSDSTVARLMVEAERLRAELNATLTALNTARLAVCGIAMGDVVKYKGVEHRVVGIDVSWGERKPWLSGNPRRKDGTFGTAVRNLFTHWEKV